MKLRLSTLYSDQPQSLALAEYEVELCRFQQRFRGSNHFVCCVPGSNISGVGKQVPKGRCDASMCWPEIGAESDAICAIPGPSYHSHQPWYRWM